jgi:hypothetical protein
MSRKQHLLILCLIALARQVSTEDPVQEEEKPINIEKVKDKLYKEMTKRKLDSIEVLVENIFIPNNIDVTSELEDLKAEIMQDLGEFEQRLKAQKEPQMVRPVFKWGQSSRKVYIHLKYSHRFDAPGCLDIYNQNLSILKEGDDTEDEEQDEDDIDIGEEDSEENEKETETVQSDNVKKSIFTGSIKGAARGRNFKFEAMCQITDSIFKYVLDFELFKDVSSWSIDKGR